MDWNGYFADMGKDDPPPGEAIRLRPCPGTRGKIIFCEHIEHRTAIFGVDPDIGIADFEAIHKSSFGWEVLPDKKTPMSPNQVAAALSEGYKRVTGKRPTQKVLQLLLGQVALETANFKSIHNFNFGNVKSKSSDQYVQYFRCSEIIDGKEVFFDPPAPECRFVAFRTAADGAEHYIRTLRGRPHWWEGLHTKSVPGFIKGLTTPPVYFTASPALYAKVLRNRMAYYTKQAKDYARHPRTKYIVAYVAVAAGYYGIHRYRKRKREAVA
jgi:hypothetical protein